MTSELQNAIKKVREEIVREKDKLSKLEDSLNDLSKKNEGENSLRESEMKKMFLQD